MLQNGVFLLQAAYDARGRPDLDARNALADAASDAGFDNLDNSASRASFAAEPGRWAEFEGAVRAAARRRGLHVRRLLYVADPGLGLCLRFSEDGQYSSLPPQPSPEEFVRMSAALAEMGFRQA